MLKKTSTSSAAPGFPASGIGKDLYNPRPLFQGRTSTKISTSCTPIVNVAASAAKSITAFTCHSIAKPRKIQLVESTDSGRSSM